MSTQLQLWTRSNNYSGTDYGEYYVGPSLSRDGDLLSTSNFESAVAMMQGLKGFEVVRFGHWGCGYIDAIMVHKNSKRAVKKLQEIMDDLEAYPILDENDYHMREQEYQDSDFDRYFDDWSKTVKEFIGVKRVNKKEMKVLIGYLQNAACGYSGTEGAFIYADNIKTLVQYGEIDSLANDGNKLAKKLLEKIAA